MKTPAISIIVTSYNDAKYLPKCLDALLAQTFDNIEIIGVNDASTDDTEKILEEYSKRDARVHYINNTENVGLAESRNRGIAEAKAPYLMFCDADDYYEPTMCEDMYNAMTESGVDVAISEIKVTYNAHKEMKMSDDNYYSLKYSGRQMINKGLVLNTDLSSTNKIFRRELLDKYNLRFPAGKRYEDAYFCVAYFCISKTAFYINRPLYNYVRHEGSIMSQTWSKEIAKDTAIDHLYIAFELYNFLEDHEILGEWEDLYWHLFGDFEAFAINNSKSHERVKQVKREALEFIAQHKEAFNATTTANQETINKLSKSRFYISTARLKQILLRFMPTYKLSIENIHALRALSKKNRQLLNRLQEYEQKLIEEDAEPSVKDSNTDTAG